MKSILTVILICCGFLSKDYDLKLRLKEGETYYQTSEIDMNIHQTLNGQDMDIKTQINGKLSFKVTQATKDDYSLETAYESMSMKLSTPQGEMTFSSEKEDMTGDFMSQIFKNIINNPFNITMSDQGYVTKIEGIDNLWSSAFDGIPELPAAQREQILDQLKRSYGEKAFKGNIEMLSAIFPDSKVSINDTWTNSIALESILSATLKNSYKLTNIDDETATIEGTSTTAANENNDFSMVNGMPTKYNLDGTASSTIKIDSKTGWINEANIKQHFKGTIEIKDNDKMPGGAVIPMTIESQTKIH